MPFKMSYKVFEDINTTQETFRSLARTQFKEVKSAYKVKRMMEELDKEYNEFLKMKAEVQKECKWEKPPEKTAPSDWKPKLINEKEIKEKIDSLLDTEVDMKWGPMTLEEIEAVKPTAMQLNVLEKLADPTVFDSLQA